MGPGLVYINFQSPLGSGVIQQLVTPVGDLRQRVIHTIHWDRSYGLGPLIAKFYLMVEANQVRSLSTRLYSRIVARNEHEHCFK